MKKFKDYVHEASNTQVPPALFVKVSGGRAQLCDANTFGNACNTFGNDIIFAQMAGNLVVTTTRDGLTQTWEIDPMSRRVKGPQNHR